MQRLTMAGGATFIGILGILVGHFAIPPPDGNPVGYHMQGYVKIDQPAVTLSSCSSKTTCYVQFDMAFDPSTDPTPTPIPCPASSSSCFSFSNLHNENLQAFHVTVDYSGYTGGPYTDYVVGVVQGLLNAPSPAKLRVNFGTTSRPSTPH